MEHILTHAAAAGNGVLIPPVTKGKGLQVANIPVILL